MKLRRAVPVNLFLLSCCAIGTARGADVANWTGGNGLWSDPSKWSGGVVPTNSGGASYTVNIDNGNAAASNVTLNNSAGDSSTIDALAIDAGDKLWVSAHDLGLAGTVATVNGALEMLGGNVTFTGAGTITGSGIISIPDSGGGMPVVAATSGSLTIDTGVTVRRLMTFDPYFGASGPRLGSASATLVNKGLIVADNGVLTIRGSAFDNQGVLEAKNNGTIMIDGPFSLSTVGTLLNNGGRFGNAGTLNNSGATLAVNQPRGWVARGTIDGGTIQTSGGGSLLVPLLGNATINNVTLNGTIQVGGSLDVTGTFGGNGTILIQGAEAIEGIGNVFLPGGVVPAGITVRGGVDTFFDNTDKGRVLVVSNQGTIRAEREFAPSARLEIFGGVPIANRGALELSDGATLTSLNSLTFFNNSKLVVDGGGLLEVVGNLSLSTLGINSSSDALEVLPKEGGGAYSNDLIATCTGSLFGTFNTVTPGIVVSYGLNQIRISGTPVPEPSMTGCAIATLALSTGAVGAALAEPNPNAARITCVTRGVPISRLPKPGSAPAARAAAWASP